MRNVVILVTFLAVAPVWAAEDSEGSPAGEAKVLSGMSVLGNNEAPKALVLVPWKSSQIGDGIGVVESLSNRPMPIDREVFGRELDYYGIRSAESESDPTSQSGLEVGSR